MGEYRMPSLGADVEDAILVEWNVKPGDRVKRGDIVATVETQKGLIEVEIFESGVIEKLVVTAGVKVPVGTVLALLTTERETTTPTPLTRTPDIAAPQAPRVTTRSAAEPVRLRVSPVARKLAEDLGVDLAEVQGTGPGGVIQRADIEQAVAKTRAPSPRAQATDRQAAMRAAIAAAMTRSKREIPHYYLATEIDMQCALTWLETENLKRPVTERVLYVALLLRSVAVAVREVPEMNGVWTPAGFRPSADVHLGVAISLRGGGLIAPAIHNADTLSVTELMRALRDLVARTRAGGLRSSEIVDQTITVTNLGEQGVPTVFGVIYPPQVAIVGFGAITQRPWAVDGLIGVRPIITATLAADHRVSDGHRGGLFLAAIGRVLQQPEQL